MVELSNQNGVRQLQAIAVLSTKMDNMLDVLERVQKISEADHDRITEVCARLEQSMERQERLETNFERLLRRQDALEESVRQDFSMRKMESRVVDIIVAILSAIGIGLSTTNRGG